MNIRIVKANENDIPSIATLFRDTIENINVRDYTPYQINAWAQRANDYAMWKYKIEQEHFWLARYGYQLVGFLGLTPVGYIDFLFVHSKWQNKGVGSLLMNEVSEYAKDHHLPKITAHVSITAKEFFSRRAFSVVSENHNKIGNVSLKNYLMEKKL